ncbi:MAG: hypothetical protein R8G66_00345 [Cytophagales bacterium]|nr:hypothetical protein [Cytophagales bacterium]
MNTIMLGLLIWLPSKAGPFLIDARHLKTEFLLSEDYEQLADFAIVFRDYSPSKENFELLFWHGLKESLVFHERLGQSKRSYSFVLRKFKRLPHHQFSHPINQETPFRTNTIEAFHILRRFTGQWHGYWEEKPVHHFWLPVRTVDITFTKRTKLLGFQSCFTGDGFGWNYVVQKKNQIIVLGFVYHYDENGALAKGNPHVGLMHQDLHLTWISDSHIYNEQVCTHPDCALGPHYVITGMAFNPNHQHHRAEIGFQAIYLSEEMELPLFQTRPIN